MKAIKHIWRIVSVLIFVSIAIACSSNNDDKAGTPSPALLHVPSPDWRDQIIYMTMIDRFNDGDPSNNDQGAGEFDPRLESKFNGGDIAGLTQKVDYMKELGATALWVTPPVANQWWDGHINYGGYHGYWAENFKEIDKHFGTLQDYKNLSHTLHSKDMYLIHDIVVNHMGNYHTYLAEYDKANTANNFSITPNSVPTSAPTQTPFNLNDRNNPEHQKADIYHWTPRIKDFNDQHQLFTYQLADLDDINTDNPVAQKALRDSHSYWIKEVGVDAFRVDTVFYVPPDFFHDFLYSQDETHPGIDHVARATGRNHFISFGEGFGLDKPYEDTQSLRIQSYMRNDDGKQRLPSMINFTLYGAIADVFARNQPTAQLAYRLKRTMEIYQNPHIMPTFVDNHDVSRFLKDGDIAGLKQALLFIMTVPGIPTIYYGTEQAFTEQRATLFKEGFGANGRDHFDQQSEMFRYLQRVIKLRKEHQTLRHGNPTVLFDNTATAGALVYRMAHETQPLFVMLNTASSDVLASNIATELDEGSVLACVFSIEDSCDEIVVGKNGVAQILLPAQAGRVYRVSNEKRATAQANVTLSINEHVQATDAGDVVLNGHSAGAQQLFVIPDGQLNQAIAVTPNSAGKWKVELRTDNMLDESLIHQVVLWDKTSGAVSAPVTFKVNRVWKKLGHWQDNVHDDNGPTGNYVYPQDHTYKDKRPQDIRAVTVFGSGGALRLDVQLTDLYESWNPVNGFDHLVLSAFFQLPNTQPGSIAMPFQNADLNNGFNWHYRARVGGWVNAIFHHDNASATSDGTALSYAARITTDKSANTISLMYPAAAFKNLKTLSGIKLYLNTWDYDMSYKDIAPTPSKNAYGGASETAAKIMDETDIITIP